MGTIGVLKSLVAMTFLGHCPQEADRPGEAPPKPVPPSARTVKWRNGAVLRVRVPVARPGRELMTTVSFPEERIETAVTGWGENAITATAQRGLLFLRLPKKGSGHVNVIGGSGTHYLLLIHGVEEGDYDPYVRIEREDESQRVMASPTRRRGRPRPVGSVELIQAMRLGLRPEGGRIFRAKGEVAYESERIVIRLLYVYRLGSYRGRIYEIENRTRGRQPIDASRFRSKGEMLILSGLRENVLGARKKTRLYTVSWSE